MADKQNLSRDPGMFRILRYFSITSLVIFLLAAGLLVTLYRQVAIKGIVDLGERSNVTLAQTALNSVHEQLVEYLTIVASRGKMSTGRWPLTARLDRAVQNIMRDTTVVRIKIHNNRGTIVFSTNHEKIGTDESGNPGFISAIRGEIASRFIYRDNFNPFAKITEDDNLIQTYLPVRRSPTTPALGVFEIYTDGKPLVKDTEHTSLVIMAGAAAVLLLLYAALLILVRRIARIMERQQDIIYERTRALEMVSAGLLTGQENERKRVSEGLHEGLAQTLSGVKMKLENALHRIDRDRTGADGGPLDDVLHALQNAIQEVRMLAMELRPPSLDQLGLLDTLSWHFRKFRQTHPGISLESEIKIEEEYVPDHLKTIIYRIVQEILDHMARQRRVNTVRLVLAYTREHIILTLSDSGLPYRAGGQPAVAPDEVAVASARERVVLSGGMFSVEATPWGATTIRATWPVPKRKLASLA